MKRLVMASLLCVVFATSTGCCLLDRIFMCHGCYGGCGGWGCESYPGPLCASDRAHCESCDSYGNYTGPSHDYYPSYGPPADAVWSDGPAPQRTHQRPQQPTPAERVPPGSQTRQHYRRSYR